MPPDELRLRPICPEDEAFLYRAYATTRANEMAVVPWDDAEKAAFLRMQFDAQHRYYQDVYREARFEVILQGDVPIGRLYVDRRADEIRIIDIIVMPEHRGAGLGSGLLRGLLEEAAAAGKPVRIHVERENPALRLYQRLGFREIGDAGVYFLMEWSPDAAATEARSASQ